MTAIYAGAAAFAAGFAGWAGADKLAQQPLKGWKLWLCAGICALIGLGCGCLLPKRTEYIPGIWRMIAALAGLTGAAVCDWREKRIPNLFPFALLAASAAACVLDLAVQPGTGIDVVAGCALGGVVILLILLLFRGICRLFLHQAGIGWGDVKLLAALGCLVGLNFTVATMLFGQVAAMLGAIVLLMARKVGIKDGIAFAPFIHVGFLITVLLGPL